VLRSARRVIPFIHTHWAFSYEHGFLKRGLVGECLSRMGLLPVPFTVEIFSLCLFLAVAACLLWRFRVFARHAPRHPGAFLFLLWGGNLPRNLATLCVGFGTI